MRMYALYDRSRRVLAIFISLAIAALIVGGVCPICLAVLCMFDLFERTFSGFWRLANHDTGR
jgi:hypothetical protein